jgi:lipopolysaccharide transport system ATP-binding protein
MGEVVISLTNISKCFKRYSHPIERLKEALQPEKHQDKAFWALHRIDLEIIKGETLGIIGRNGSGKSTLLQIIAGTLTPTTGQVDVNGRVAALLELGSGFNPDFTGRQNVFFNGRLLGLSKPEIEANFDRIAAFADIGDFLDQPVKTYSSGMLVRLAFAVQAHLSPDILIVDEALSVGDIFFQQKCARRLNELRERGTTLLFVSHDMATVRNLCSRAIYLKHGIMVAQGDTKTVIREYLKEDLSTGLVSAEEETVQPQQSNLELSEAQYSELLQYSIVSPGAIENELAKVLTVNMMTPQGEHGLKYRIGDRAIFQLCFQAKQPLTDVHYTVLLHNRFDQLVFCGGSYTSCSQPIQCHAGQKIIAKLEVILNIESGIYTFELSLGKVWSNRRNVGTALIETGRLGPFEVTWDYENEVAPFFGLFGLEHQSFLFQW